MWWKSFSFIVFGMKNFVDDGLVLNHFQISVTIHMCRSKYKERLMSVPTLGRHNVVLDISVSTNSFLDSHQSF